MVVSAVYSLEVSKTMQSFVYSESWHMHHGRALVVMHVCLLILPVTCVFKFQLDLSLSVLPQDSMFLTCLILESSSVRYNVLAHFCYLLFR